MSREKTLREEISHACRFDEMADLKEVLQRHGYDIQRIITSYVAYVCGVDEDEILASSHKPHISQSRWMLWRALRYITGDTYDQIAERTRSSNYRFTGRGVGKGITNITSLINTTPIWGYRWRMVSNAIQFCREQLLNNDELLNTKQK